ncbi:MAG: hypothetical protein ACKESB_01530 [Candidatus Hodgkinia cicadicola]
MLNEKEKGEKKWRGREAVLEVEHLGEGVLWIRFFFCHHSAPTPQPSLLLLFLPSVHPSTQPPHFSLFLNPLLTPRPTAAAAPSGLPPSSSSSSPC